MTGRGYSSVLSKSSERELLPRPSGVYTLFSIPYFEQTHVGGQAQRGGRRSKGDIGARIYASACVIIEFNIPCLPSAESRAYTGRRTVANSSRGLLSEVYTHVVEGAGFVAISGAACRTGR